MKLMSSGAAEGVPLANGMTVREEQRSYESNLWLLPNPDLWGPDEVIIEGPDSSYSAHDLAPGAGFWDEIGYSDGNLIYAGLDGLFDISDVGVETHVKCVREQASAASAKAYLRAFAKTCRWACAKTVRWARRRRPRSTCRWAPAKTLSPVRLAPFRLDLPLGSGEDTLACSARAYSARPALWALTHPHLRSLC
jgi:hypothetical protein